MLSSEYRSMWLFALFDLPVDDKDRRREYVQFRKALLKEGFTMLQYSVYARHGVSEESIEAVRGRVRAAIPPHGQIRLIAVTDHQFGKMEVFFGKKRVRVEDPPSQLVLF